MKKLILALLLLIPTIGFAGITYYDPLPPDSSIPTTAIRNTNCVGVDDAGNVYCNVNYRWRNRVNRFCCTINRYLSFKVNVNNEIIWIPPVESKTDTVIYEVSNAGYIAGGSSLAGGSQGVGTYWIDLVPTPVLNTLIFHISNVGYVTSSEVLDFNGVNYRPADCGAIFALNDLYDGLCAKTAEDIIGGLAKFYSDVTDGNNFITTVKPVTASMNNNGDSIFNYSTSFGTSTGVLASGIGKDINDSGDYVGSISGVGMKNSVTIPGTTIINAINNSGIMACQNSTVGCKVE